MSSWIELRKVRRRAAWIIGIVGLVVCTHWHASALAQGTGGHPPDLSVRRAAVRTAPAQGPAVDPPK